MGDTLKLREDAGLSVLEVMIASLIITVALLSIAMTMIQGIAAVHYTQEQLVAKQKAREALESVFTARSTQDITFDQIQNTSIIGGIFLEGFQAIRGMGIDGIANTGDDAVTDIESLSFPGPDGLLGTIDDQTVSLANYERKMTITDVFDTDGNIDPNIRQITVEVRFQENHRWRSVTVTSLVSRFA